MVVFMLKLLSTCEFIVLIYMLRFFSQADIRNPLRYVAHNQITAPQFWLNVDVIFSLLIYFFRFSKLRKCEGESTQS